jgi:hydroxymethylbilane synthase
VETRIRKVDSGEYDAIILAEAGLVRLGLADRVAEVFSITEMLPAPGQGILALVANRDSHDVISLLSQIDDPISRCEGEAEREVARVLAGGCKVPIGVLADVHDSYLSISGCTLSLDGRDRLYAKRTGSKADGIVLAREVGNELLQQGAKKLEEGWRTMYA